MGSSGRRRFGICLGFHPKKYNSVPDGYIDHDELPGDAVPKGLYEFAAQFDVRHFGRMGNVFIAGPNKSARIKAARTLHVKVHRSYAP